MRVVLLGPPGSGKGTQAKLIERRLGVPHISAGDLLRGAVVAGTEIGRAAQGYMERGELVPDEVVTTMIEQRICETDCERGFLLDGFPRNVAQAVVLDDLLRGKGQELDHVVFLSVAREELWQRLNGRRRDDDRADTVRARLEVYENETAPLCDYYRARSLLRSIDGIGTVEEILDRILARVAAA